MDAAQATSTRLPGDGSGGALRIRSHPLHLPLTGDARKEQRRVHHFFWFPRAARWDPRELFSERLAGIALEQADFDVGA